MKKTSAFPVLVGVVLCVAAITTAQTKPSPAFETLKTLVGQWEGKTESGNAVRASYKIVSGGSALLESLQPGDEPEMVTVYTADGDRLAVTHFCSANNQPQMRTAAVTGATRDFAFHFVNATNLPTQATGHMHALTVVLEDHDHFTQKWTWRENGHDKMEVFHFVRKT